MSISQRLHGLGWALMLIVLGLNLRPILTSISPLLNEIRESSQLGFQEAALLTTLPVVCMGLVALLSAGVEARLGEGRGIALGLLCILLACTVRGFTVDGRLLLGSALFAGIGVALIQVLVPGLVKRLFVGRVALAMGIYSAALMGGGGLAAQFSPRLASHFGHWQAGLLVWMLPALLALLLWLKMPWRAAQPLAAGQSVQAFMGNRRAWLLALYFGFSNCGYMTVVAWLPAYYQQLGWSSPDSGSLLALMTVFQVLAALTMPALAQRMRERRGLLSVSLIAQLLGFGGLLLYPQSAPILWVALIGFGLGACFALSLILSLDHLHEPRAAGQLAAFVQGFGFLINALAPSLSGWLREQTGGFQATWLLMLVCMSVMLAVTWRFSPASYCRISTNSRLPPAEPING
ncbi:CynX/NimT family MFS transporter [Pseudomonas lalucatii]|uniref:CynX/NimT family MFS transporter n=1 Tax=Pseudomonas lalucatii TaxID=1424203 RepID=A0ABS5PWF7_9PSED|nr:CynX/NimT family MFS transporter [Pseudomonas lalucatii]MBS7660832.1 CynX/NimT family MFS transporter [Pseudomonas lalucatii]MBS7724423.1 CynX/NimT family MFS transporter [Pseudomonas lalucatii]QVM87589.1 CynX/NimT family MFS transporter [Pseudomonas lalucatii]